MPRCLIPNLNNHRGINPSHNLKTPADNSMRYRGIQTEAQGRKAGVHARENSERPRAEVQPIGCGQQRPVIAGKHGRTLSSFRPLSTRRDHFLRETKSGSSSPIGRPGPASRARPVGFSQIKLPTPRTPRQPGSSSSPKGDLVRQHAEPNRHSLPETRPNRARFAASPDNLSPRSATT